nr:hypothetical protein [uncultured bacterium]
MVDDFRTLACLRRLDAAGWSLFRVAAVRVRAMGMPTGLNQSCLVGWPPARHPVRQVGREAMAPLPCQHHSREFRPWSAIRLALAATASYNKPVHRTAFGGRWPLR